MHHPHDKFIRFELIAIAAALLIGLLALIKGFLFLILFACYLLVVSIICTALTEWNCRQQLQAGKSLVRAVLLFIFITYLLFHL